MFRSVLQSPKELDTGSYDGELATYSGGGYVQNLHFQNVCFQAHGYLFLGCQTKMSLDVDNVPQDGADVDEKNVRSKIVRLTKLSDLVLGCIKTVFPCSIFDKSNFQFL